MTICIVVEARVGKRFFRSVPSHTTNWIIQRYTISQWTLRSYRQALHSIDANDYYEKNIDKLNFTIDLRK